MNIVYIIDRLFDAGTQRHLCQLAGGIHKMGHRVHIVCLEDEGPQARQLREQGIRVTAMHTAAIYTPDSLKKLFVLVRLLRAERPDIVQTFLLKANLMGTVAAHLARVPVVLSTRRSLGYDFKPSHYFMLKLLDGFVAATLTNSDAIRETTIDKEGISPRKLFTIHNGIDGRAFARKENSLLKRQLNIPVDTVVIGTVANIRPVKGYQYLFLSLAQIVKKHPNTLCLVVGNVDNHRAYFEDLEALAERLGLRSNIRFLHGWKDIPGILSLVDIAVLPSISEGFSNTLLEYMAARKPIVATRVGGNPEAVVHGHSGLLVPPKNADKMARAILRLMGNAKLARTIAVNAEARVATHFSLKSMLERHRQFYERRLNSVRIKTNR